jgi:hypothetical protein
MSNCTCGRTTRPPLCDNSHVLTDEQYAERTERLSKIKANIKRNNWVNTVANNLPEHSEYIGHELLQAFEKSPYSEIDTHAIALVAALVSGNGELGFEIGMNGPLISTHEREVAKLAAALVYSMSIYQFIVAGHDSDKWKDLYESLVKGKSGMTNISDTQFYLYLLAGAIVLKDKQCIETNPIYWAQVEPFSLNIKKLAKLCSIVASIGKISL